MSLKVTATHDLKLLAKWGQLSFQCSFELESGGVGGGGGKSGPGLLVRGWLFQQTDEK